MEAALRSVYEIYTGPVIGECKLSAVGLAGVRRATIGWF